MKEWKMHVGDCDCNFLIISSIAEKNTYFSVLYEFLSNFEKWGGNYSQTEIESTTHPPSLLLPSLRSSFPVNCSWLGWGQSGLWSSTDSVVIFHNSSCSTSSGLQ